MAGPSARNLVLTGIGSGAAPAEQRGTATSLQATALFGGQFASPLVFGPLIDATSIATGALVAASGTAGILGALFRLREPDPPSSAADLGRDGPREAPIGEQA